MFASPSSPTRISHGHLSQVFLLETRTPPPTESAACAFKARGIPTVLRVIEIMGIEQGRAWVHVR